MTTHPTPATPPELSGRHRHTFEAVFRHPAAHNLEWHDIRSLLAALGDVTEEPNGSLRVTRDNRHMTLHAPKHKDVATTDDLLAVRRFLEQAAKTGAENSPLPGAGLLVVIDHHEAKVYRSVSHGATPERLAPDDPHGHRRHLHARNEETDGKRPREQASYYRAVAAALHGADRIVLFGSGTGESSALEELLADLRHHHPGVADRVVGTAVIDAHHQTEGQLLAQAREVFAGLSGETRDTSVSA